jgi:hypothetical protein
MFDWRLRAPDRRPSGGARQTPHHPNAEDGRMQTSVLIAIYGVGGLLVVVMVTLTTLSGIRDTKKHAEEMRRRREQSRRDE